jgi:hypothetical protein
MTLTTSDRVPQATLREEWAFVTVQRWAWTMGRPSTVPVAVVAMAGEPATTAPAPSSGPAAVADLDARRAQRAEALLRLATDPRATAHERSLAADRAATFLRPGA